jgi:hypothetical protein
MVDCWRCKDYREEKEIKYKKLGHPFGLFVCTILLVLVQVMISTEWMILEKPEVEKKSLHRQQSTILTNKEA